MQGILLEYARLLVGSDKPNTPADQCPITNNYNSIRKCMTVKRPQFKTVLEDRTAAVLPRQAEATCQATVCGRHKLPARTL